MVKNYMADVAKMLGVELEEEFMAANKVAILKISAKDGLMCKFKDNENWQYGSLYLQELLMGDMEIIKLPWKPKYGDKYYSYVVGWTIMKCTWMNYVSDYTRLKSDIVFRTSQEALNALPQKYKELTGKKYE